MPIANATAMIIFITVTWEALIPLSAPVMTVSPPYYSCSWVYTWKIWGIWEIWETSRG